MKQTYVLDRKSVAFVQDDTAHKMILFYQKICVALFSIIIFLLISSINRSSEINNLLSTIENKNIIIERMYEPYSHTDSTYISQLSECIGIKMTPMQFNKFSKLAIKYRSLIEQSMVPASLVWYIAYRESKFDKDIHNMEGSSAKGLFQFIDITWKNMCKLAGYGIGDRYDEEKQVKILLVYLDFLYKKYGNWRSAMTEYHGGKLHYEFSNLIIK